MLCRLSEAISSEDTILFLQAAAGGLSPGQAPAVQIGACRAIAHLCQQSTGAALQPHLAQIYQGTICLPTPAGAFLHVHVNYQSKVKAKGVFSLRLILQATHRTFEQSFQSSERLHKPCELPLMRHSSVIIWCGETCRSKVTG